MGFDANAQVVALEWNFRPFVDASGTTPEPSDKAVRTFLFETQRISNSLPSTSDPDFLERFNALTQEDYQEVADELLDLVATLTQDCPTKEQIESLPHRQQRAYVAWLRKEITDPEAPSDATKPSQGRLRSVAPITRSAGT